ncbi:hypothetical protein GQ55_4G097600 [Panicum hallii var. hallii]|uniref:Uncharacterized protein n=1 Tax=Panicum hallii var. hallii TaxID=1504633 RepID=A0A2T7DX04_9POAL|nr:hypothetical protein GQ55_4G097600 [Panicum hallii var. hallii]
MNNGASQSSNPPSSVRPINTACEINRASPSRAASAFGYPQMASFARAARLLTLLQVALLVVSAVLMSGSAVCHGAWNAGIHHTGTGWPRGGLRPGGSRPTAPPPAPSGETPQP